MNNVVWSVMDRILPFLAMDQSYTDIEKMMTSKGVHQLYGLSSSQKALWIGALAHKRDKPLLVITSDQERKNQWMRDFSFLLPHIEVYELPLQDRIHFAVSAKTLELQAKSMVTLSRLILERKAIVLLTIEEAAQRIIEPALLKNHLLKLSLNETIERDTLLASLVAMGYERTEQVESRGHFAVRGDILDIFTANREEPVRIEFFGDEIDRLRTFDIVTQRSVDVLEECVILPLKIKGPEISSILSYSQEGLVVLDEPNRLQEQLKNYLREKKEHETTHYTWDAFMQTNSNDITIFLSFMQHKLSLKHLKSTYGLKSKTMASFERQIPLLMDEIKHWIRRDNAIMLVMNNLQRRQSVEVALQRDHIEYSIVNESFKGEFLKGHIYILQGLISEGFELPNSHLVFVSEGNIYGQQKEKLRRKIPKGQEINYFTDLIVGDYVVHTVHGIGKYVGLKTIESSGIVKDYVEIEYAGSDKLFLPTDKLGQLQKYIGNEGVAPKLHKMGGGEWGKVTKKAKKSIDDLAKKLVTLYAEREVIEGYAFLPDQPWQQEFEEAFPYEETPDQLQATAEIKASMEEPRPMDRLLCGDVGFGKTEVAMRAIFKALMSNKQVAVLVPTTILAQQHYQTFLERFSPFGVHVEVLNRFRSAAEKKRIISDTKKGDVDILIGTHALLNKKIVFKDLGFLVVDEEQRFGVAQKEKWKDWAKSIDVLTLSATPIPRTLHMSLVGVREMSIINTPPEERLPIQTYVLEYDIHIVEEAIRRELSRGGQVFFVYNSIQSIYTMGDLLEKTMPDLKYCIAHGKMTGQEIETIMVDFYEGRYDVLLSTTIVENGIDIPNANTIIVYDADHMGLSQLYQMRGRVGRSHRRAYAYFMYRPNKVLTETAEKRLQAVKDFTELGSGFKVAMRDLEIRGAGSLLGSKQHGNIASVGFAMYCQMLEEAIAKAQDQEYVKKEESEISINLKVNAHFDDSYISDSGRKIGLYQRLLLIHSREALDDFVEEIVDRFGNPTEAASNLIRLSYIREQARELGIQSIQLTPFKLDLLWGDEEKIASWDMGKMDSTMWKRLSFGKGKPLVVHVDVDDHRNKIIGFTERLLESIYEACQ